MDTGSKHSTQTAFKSASMMSMFQRMSLIGSSTSRNQGTTSESLSTLWGGDCFFWAPFLLRGGHFLGPVAVVFSFFLGHLATAVLSFFLAHPAPVPTFLLADAFLLSRVTMGVFGFFDCGLSLSPRGCLSSSLGLSGLSGVIWTEGVIFPRFCLFAVGYVFGISFAVAMHVIECFLGCNCFA